MKRSRPPPAPRHAARTAPPAQALPAAATTAAAILPPRRRPPYWGVLHAACSGSRGKCRWDGDREKRWKSCRWRQGGGTLKRPSPQRFRCERYDRRAVDTPAVGAHRRTPPLAARPFEPGCLPRGEVTCEGRGHTKGAWPTRRGRGHGAGAGRRHVVARRAARAPRARPWPGAILWRGAPQWGGCASSLQSVNCVRFNSPLSKTALQFNKRLSKKVKSFCVPPHCPETHTLPSNKCHYQGFPCYFGIGWSPITSDDPPELETIALILGVLSSTPLIWSIFFHMWQPNALIAVKCVNLNQY